MLIQTVVKPAVLRKLDALARATGHTRASYLRHLVELHVRAINPKLAKALARGKA
jgi:predicted DNA-binding protein